MKASLLLASIFGLASPFALRAGCSVTEGAHPGGPGKQIFIKLDGKPVAGLVHGDGQFKPYLHDYGDAGELIPNGAASFFPSARIGTPPRS